MYDSYSEYYGLYDVKASVPKQVWIGVQARKGGDEARPDTCKARPSYDERMRRKREESMRMQEERRAAELNEQRTLDLWKVLGFAIVSGIVIFFGVGIIVCGPGYDAFLANTILFAILGPVQGVIWFISIGIFSEHLAKKRGEYDPDEARKTARNVGVIGAGMAAHHAKHLGNMGRTLMSGK